MEAATVSQILLLLPLVTAGIIACFLRRRHWVASLLSVGSGAVFSILGLVLIYGGTRFGWSHTWLSLGEEFSFQVGVKFDDLAALMLLILIVVGLLVQVFSLGYMKGDPGKARFFAGLSFFMFSMSGIILADNLALLCIFWELVGFSSYVLINHYFDQPAAVAASKKAFVLNRVGDFGLLLGILFVYGQFGTFDLTELEAKAAIEPGLLSTAMGLLLFCGVLGKSAQIPLHVWLPDAMEGPTPISALIHAATMVAAGIYFMARVYFLMTPGALEVVLWIGTITAAFAALVAFGPEGHQEDFGLFHPFAARFHGGGAGFGPAGRGRFARGWRRSGGGRRGCGSHVPPDYSRLWQSVALFECRLHSSRLPA